MNNLADLLFELVWNLEFSSEDDIDPDFAVSNLETIWHSFNTVATAEEKEAFIGAVKRAQARLLAKPDEHGYTPRSLITEDQKEFLKILSNGDFT